MTSRFDATARVLLHKVHDAYDEGEEMVAIFAALQSAYTAGRNEGIEDAAKVAYSYAPGAAYAVRALAKTEKEEK